MSWEECHIRRSWTSSETVVEEKVRVRECCGAGSKNEVGVLKGEGGSHSPVLTSSATVGSRSTMMLRGMFCTPFSEKKVLWGESSTPTEVSVGLVPSFWICG